MEAVLVMTNEEIAVGGQVNFLNEVIQKLEYQAAALDDVEYYDE